MLDSTLRLNIIVMFEKKFALSNLMLSQLYCYLNFPFISEFFGVLCAIAQCEENIFVLSPLMFAGLLIKEKKAFEGRECVKDFRLHSSFISSDVKVSITFETCN